MRKAEIHLKTLCWTEKILPIGKEMPAKKGEIRVAKNGARYRVTSKGCRFISGASASYLAKIRKKRGKGKAKKKGGGLQREVVNTLGTVGINTGRRYEARKRARAKGGGLDRIHKIARGQQYWLDHSATEEDRGKIKYEAVELNFLKRSSRAKLPI